VFHLRDAIRAARGPFVATRLAIPLIGLLAIFTIGFPAGEPRVRATLNELTNLPMRWDAGWYVSIAREGYFWSRRQSDRQLNIVFFPAYPMMMRAVARVFGRHEAAYLTAAVLISHVAFFWALLLLYELARADLGDDDGGRGAVLLLVCYPFSVFHGAAYTESLFLLAVVGAVLELRRGRPAVAAGWGLLAGLTRPNGFLLAATLATMLLTKDGLQLWGSIKQRALALTAVVAPILGVAIYSAFIGMLTGNPLQWSEQQTAWGRGLQSLPFASTVAFIADEGVVAYLTMLPYDVMNVVPALFALALVVPIGRRFGAPYAVFLLANLLPGLLTGGAMSMGRFTATMFPLFIWLAAWRRATLALAAAFAMLQGFAAVLFYTWRGLF
jgi:Mannosyltransferase (PIG-V)